MTSKASISSDLRALGVELSASKLKKTTLARLQAMLHAKRAGAQRASHVALMPRRSKGINLPPKPASQLCACRAGSKQAILIDHLARGATLAELVAALNPWTESSVKSALYWDVAKVKGYPDGLPTADHSASAVAITRSPW
jgi:hypothetical protein